MKLACSFFNIVIGDRYWIQEPCMSLIGFTNTVRLPLGIESEKVHVKWAERYQSHVAYNSIC